MQASALQAESFNAGIGKRHATEAFGQQAVVAVIHDWGGGKYITDLDHGIHEPGFDCASNFRVIVFRLAGAVVGQHIN